ncbi:apolipoprotein acyltransferase [Planotetraspora thailandica]|uniref:Apolipoprotein acyltransferase n=1 Tax=Planotetraspora thailandica TaxID=487172 RepID=A0A8J3V7A3_9ACTN|nr:carbon-nitrogen hydrolase family protein [Planotetraspora thailandica]GII56236.1 apolipoprotein acyltransferase [Planotetraspora thailandica]
MSRALPLALVQEPPTSDVDGFADAVHARLASLPQTRLIAYPELHVCGADDVEAMAEPLDGPRGKRLAELAGDLGIWLLPGTVVERGDDGAIYNTAVAYSPEGRLAASYRKMFPWRPYEPYAPGDRFVVFDIPEAGRLGFAVCYDAWFPEAARHLAWMGAEIIVNPVKTTTCDRAQELVLARANAIVNQVFVLSVNAAGPQGAGESMIVDPEGRVRAAVSHSGTAVLTDVIDLDDVARVRRYGTAGLNRMWSQFLPGDTPIDLPLYEGRLHPDRWRPGTPQ